MLRELTGSTRGLFSLSLFSGWGIGVWCGPGCGGAWVGFCWHGSPCTPLPDPPHPPQSGRTSCQTTSPNTPLDRSSWTKDPLLLKGFERVPMFRFWSCPGPLVPWPGEGMGRNFGSRCYLRTKFSPLCMLGLHDLQFCSAVFEK